MIRRRYIASPQHVAFWDAVIDLTLACGGQDVVTVARQVAVAKVEADLERVADDLGSMADLWRSIGDFVRASGGSTHLGGEQEVSQNRDQALAALEAQGRIQYAIIELLRLRLRQKRRSV